MFETVKLPSVRLITRRLPAVGPGLRLRSMIHAPDLHPPLCPERNSQPQIEIPVRDSPPDAAECVRLRRQGRSLARQEDWAVLSRALRKADAGRAASIGGTPVARLLAEGAHADALDSALAAVGRNDPTRTRGILFGLHDAMDGIERDPWLACVLALAHLRVAGAWLGRPGAPAPTPLRRDARAQHLETAYRLTCLFDPLEHDSPILAAIRCAVAEIWPQAALRLADDFEDLIDLDPGCPDHMRALGRDLMPCRFGSWEWLEAEARRTAGRTADLWGAGGYAWVWFDALAGADGAGFAHVDAELFVEGLHDILDRRPDQHMANLLAAYCGLTLSGAAAAGSARDRIAGCFGWIAQNHLREIHPRLWVCARPLPGIMEPGEAPSLGRARALSALAEHFAHQLRLGRQVRFVPDGISLTPTPCASCTLAPCSALAYPLREMRDEETLCST